MTELVGIRGSAIHAGWRNRLPALLLVVFGAGRVHAQDLLFNGHAFDSERRVAVLSPGVVNRVEIARAAGDAEGEPLLIAWELTAPDGRVRTGEARIEPGAARSASDIGPLAVPPVYEYEAGRLWQRGYRLVVDVTDGTGRRIRSWTLFQEHGATPSDVQQGMGEADPSVQRVRFVEGGDERVVYNPRFGALGPLSLRLGETVLVDPDALEVRARLNAGEVPGRMKSVLRAVYRGEALWTQEVELVRGDGWKSLRVDAAGWPAGEVVVELLPRIDGRLWEGPRVAYRRRQVKREELAVSPVAPWTLERDASRQEIRITDLRAASRKAGDGDAAHWRWLEEPDGGRAAASDGNDAAPPLMLRPDARGWYAVFASVEDGGGLIQVGRYGLIRGVAPSDLARELFVEAADLTDSEIRIHPSRDPKAKFVAVRLVPVTASSAERLALKLATPVLPMLSVNDWAEYFGMSGARLLPDQFASIVCVQAEFGFRTVGWSVGRSWVEYPTTLPHARIFPCVPYEEARKSPDYPDDPYDYGPRIVMMNRYDPLGSAIEAGKRCQAGVWAWLAMQRHYGTRMYGGIFACPFFRDHPEWRQVGKDGQRTGLSFYYPGVRKERVDILVEVAARGADGLLVGCDRQVPMLQYEPELVEAFRAATGIDPLKIDVSSRPEYERWIRFRAEFFTETLRELQRRLAPVRAARGAPIPVGIRIPSGGLFLNLAQGLDVETWCRERLVTLIDLDPLEECPGVSDHDVRPHLELGRRCGVRVFGGMGSTAFRPANRAVLTPGLRRARGLQVAGVDGIDTFETEILTWTDPVRFLVALYGHPGELDRFLRESNIEAVYPIDAGTAAAGHDNHSVWRPGWTWSLTGFTGKSL